MPGGTFGSGTFGSGLFGGYGFDSELQAYQTEPLVLVEIDFPSGKQYFAGTQARFTERQYSGKMLTVSSFRRALQKNLGLFEIASTDIELADVDGALLRLSSTEQIKGRLATLKIGTRRLPLGLFRVWHEGKIDDFGSGNYTFRIMVKDRLWTLPATPDTGYVNETDFPYAFPDHVGKPLPVCYGVHVKTDLAVGDTSGTQNAKFRGSWPTLFVDVRTSERVFLIARHAIQSIDNVYAYTPGRGSVELTSGTHYTAYLNGTLNGETMAFIKITNTGWTDKVTDTSGNLAVVTVNVHGKEVNGDGTGELIENPADVLADLLGSYLGSPPINGAKFEDTRSVGRTRQYRVSGGIVEDKKTEDVLADLADSFNMRIFPDSSGQVAVDIFQPASPGSTVTEISEQWDVLQEQFAIDFTADVEGSEDAQVINFVDYAYSFHYAQNYFLGSKTTQNTESVDTYGMKKLKLNMPWNGSAAGALDVASRYIFLYKDPVANVNLSLPLRGVLLDLTDQINITHGAGHISGGYDSRRFEVQEHVLNPQDGTVDIRAKDVAKLVEGAIFLDDSDAESLADTGTAGVVNGDATVTVTSGPADLSILIEAGDICWLIDPTNEGNRKHFVVAAPITATTFEAADSSGTPITVWTTESGISYRIVPSWTTATAAKKLWYGWLCNAATGQFSDATAGKQLK